MTPGAENKHLKAFRVFLKHSRTIKALTTTMKAKSSSMCLTGKIEVVVGEHVNTLEQGESLHFNSGIRHKLKSISDETAELIVVIYTP